MANRPSPASPAQWIRTVSESFIARYRPESQSTDWGQSLAMYGLLRGLSVEENPKVRAYLRQWLAFHLAEGVPVNYFCGSWSVGLLYPDVCSQFPEFQLPLRDTALRIYEFITRTALRNGEGTLLHNIDLPNIYIDTVYYSAVVLSKIGPALGLPWQAEAVRQIVLHLDRLQDGTKPFFIHCEENNGGRRSEGSWARGNGWVMMTLAEVLPVLDGAPAWRKDLTSIFRQLAEAIERYQTPSGLWRTLLDDRTAYPEVSASAMNLFAMLRGARSGLLGAEFERAISKSMKAMSKAVDGEGRVLGVSEGTWPGTVAYYKSLVTGEWWWGTGAFLLAMTEAAERDKWTAAPPIAISHSGGGQ